MSRQLLAGVGFFLGLWGLAVVWLTAESPILGNRAFNWLTILALLGLGWYCLHRAGLR
jgi:hypothetical protein